MIRIVLINKMYPVVFFTLIILLFPRIHAQEMVDFESDQWILESGKIEEFMGRKSLTGRAYLKDIEFENGIIEVDVAVDGNRCFPGIMFRMKDQRNLETIYFRPHRPKFPDTLQYAPIFNGLTCWQLYSGKGYTSPVDVPPKKWIHIKMEISGTQARVFWNNSKKPVMDINYLQRGKTKGMIGVSSSVQGRVYFSNFKYRIDNNLGFKPAPKIETPEGIITDWMISSPLRISTLQREVYPGKEKLARIKWKNVIPDPTGLLNISRFVTRAQGELECVFAKTNITSDKHQKRKLFLGYSDQVHVFLNGKILFSGDSTYKKRSEIFPGVIGLNDALFLDLKRGNNELLFVVTERFGGWGLMARLAEIEEDVIFEHRALSKLWETPSELKLPESAVYDPKRNKVYVSNVNQFGDGSRDFISQVSTNGIIENLEWIGELRGPTGITIFKDKLYVVERTGLATIDIEKRKIIKRYPALNPGFLNDVAIDQSGNIYVSDSDKNVILKQENGRLIEWLKGNEINQPNGLCIIGKKLFYGNREDSTLKYVDLKDHKITKFASFDAGVIDGIRPLGEESLLVSVSRTQIYKISRSGETTKLIDTTVPRIFLADFEYIRDKKLLIIPTLTSNRLIAYKLELYNRD